MMCQPLCKLLGHELSCITTEEKIPTSEVVKTCKTVGLMFVEDEILEESSGDLEELCNSLKHLFENQKKGTVEPTSSLLEVVLVPVRNATLPKDSKCRIKIEQFLCRRGCSIYTISSKNASKIQEYLIRKYEVQQTPSLTLINAITLEVITYEGKDKLLKDPKGRQFPWNYPSFSEILKSAKLVKNMVSNTFSGTGQEINSKDLKTREVQPEEWRSSIKGLLFAAFWCPPCRSFVSVLNELYERVNKNGKTFEVIFVSSDRSQESFQRFFATMPWIAVPYNDENLRNLLMKVSNVKAIPSLTILDANDKLITSDGRLEINDDIDGIEFPWYPRLVDELRDRHTSVVNNSLCVIYFTDDTEADYEKAELIFNPIATKIVSSNLEEACEPKFFIAADSDLSESLRIFMDLDETKSYLVITDIASLRYSVRNQDTGENNITEKSVEDFLADFQNNKLTYKYIQARFI